MASIINNSHCFTKGNFKPICFDFLRGNCGKNLSDCPKVHAYLYCRDFQSGKRCENQYCKLMHVSLYEQFNYNKTAIQTDKIIQEAIRTCQVSGVCRENLEDNCKKDDCSMKHLKIGAVVDRDEVLCPICGIKISADLLVITKCCNHGICLICSERLKTIENLFCCPYCWSRGPDLILCSSF